MVPFTVSESGDGGDPVSGLVAPDEAIAFDGPGTDGVDGGFQLDVENQHSDPIRVTDVTVVPDDSRLNGLSDVAAGNGPGRSELYVESESGDIGDKNVLLADGPFIGGQYTFVPNDGLTLNLQDGPEKRAYDTDEPEYFDADTEFDGDEVGLAPSERATITFAEFYEVGETTATVADVTDERFSVTVGYKKDGERLTRQFVTTVTGDSAGSVNVQDTIQADDGEFDVTTDNFQSLNQGFVVVENQGSGESTDFTAGNGETTPVTAGEVGGLAEGNEITATLFDEENGKVLDDDATTVTAVQPTFDSLTADASEQGNQIVRVDFDGSINNVDETGEIRFELDGNDGESQSEEIDMTENVDHTLGPFGGGRRVGTPADVTITLLDSDGNPYETVTGTFNGPNGELSLNNGLTRE